MVNAEEDESRFEGNQWLETTQWAVILDGRDRRWLQDFLRPVDEEKEAGLVRVIRSLRRVIGQA